MDDVSDIPSSGCSVLTGEHSLSNYNANIRKDYIQNGGHWYLYRTQSSYNAYDISNYNCINPGVLNTYAVYQPIFYAVGFALFVFVIHLVIKTVKGFLYGI